MLRLEHVTMKFGGLIADNDVCTQVNKGEIFGLIGPNGAGKTTLFNMISGYYKPTSGTIYFDGQYAQGKKANEVAKLGIARTYQNINLFKTMTVLENVLVGCHIQTKASLMDAILSTKKSIDERSKAIEACHGILEFMGIDHLSESLSGSLPYGDQRRLEIARALASKPKLLLLDEPAAGMNLTEKEELKELILRIRDVGHTIILVEHNMKLVMQVCDRICVLNHGSKIAEGLPVEIQNNPEVISAYLGGKR